MPSPDRPASFLHRLFGIQDTEPPISDQEYARYVQYREGIPFAPADALASLPRCPRKANRRTRRAVRALLADPRFDRTVALMEDTRQQRDEQRKAEEADALRTKLEAIDAFHDNQLNEVSFRFKEFAHLLGSRSLAEATTRMAVDSQSEHTKRMRGLNTQLASKGSDGMLWGALASGENSMRDGREANRIAHELRNVTLRRSLSTMEDAERATLRMADVMVALGVMDNDERKRIAVPVVWNGGQGMVDYGDVGFRVGAAMLETLRPLIATTLGTASGAREHLHVAVRRALGPESPLAPELRTIIERYLYSGNRWLTPAEIPAHTSPSFLRLGRFLGSEHEFTYDQRESLITIAPPGSGKSQALVLRNLLYLNAPAVVLDIKGEMHRGSKAWREANVGPTYTFAPQDPSISFSFNPLDEVREDENFAWSDARRLADLLVVPSGKGDQYFENRARDMITTAVLDVALSEPDASRNVDAVLERIYLSGDQPIRDWCDTLEKVGNLELKRQASALRGMPERQREGIFDEARRQLEIWQSPLLKDITRSSSFNAETLRADNATLYLMVALEDVKKYASILRVLLGQTLLKLYQVQAESGAVPVTFFLDEMPRLGRLDVIEECLDVGRGYGVRLWMFCQNIGQLRKAYPNPEGFLSNCAVRTFINQDEEEAQWISRHLGTRAGLLDGERKPLVEPHELTGPDFKDQMVVFSREQYPARLQKTPAYRDPVCIARMESTGGTTAAVNVAEPVEATSDTWDSIASAPVGTPIRSAQVVPSPSRLPAFALGTALVLLVLLAGWAAMQAWELRGLRTEKGDLVAAKDSAARAAQVATSDKDRLAQSLRTAESERDSARALAQTTRLDLQRERDAHAATREKLAATERALNDERSQRQRMPQVSNALPEVAAPAPVPPMATPRMESPVAVAPAECDELAANPTDIRKVTAGIAWPTLRRNAAAAIAACERAARENPRELRFTYQLARALAAANDPRASAIFQRLANAGYPAAFDNLGQSLLAEGRTEHAADAFRRGAALGDPDSMVSLASLIRTGRLLAQKPSEDAELFESAARLGHPGAQAELAKRSPPVR